MKSVVIFPALLATALGAAVPVPAPADGTVQLPTTYDGKPLTEADLDVEPFVNFVPLQIQGEDPIAFLAEETPSPIDEGALAWATVKADIARDVAITAPTGNEKREPQLIPDRPGGPNDFHFGISARDVCTYLRGAAWKARDLRRPVQQWEPEYVPWLITNQGPYIYVLDGLRDIEYILWKLTRALAYSSVFTDFEERAIIRCYYEFSGYEQQITTLPTTGLPGTNVPRDVTATRTAVATRVPLPFPTTLPTGNPFPVPFPPRPEVPGYMAWNRRFSLKSLVRLMGNRAEVSRYQTYANHRITNVLQNLELSVTSIQEMLYRKFKDPRAKSYLEYDMEGTQGLPSTLFRAIVAFNWDTARTLQGNGDVVA